MREHEFETHLEKAKVTWTIDVKSGLVGMDTPYLMELKITFTNEGNSVHWEVENTKDKADAITPAMKERVIEECLKRGVFSVIRR